MPGSKMETPSRLAQSSCRLSQFFQGRPRASPATSGPVANANRDAGGGTLVRAQYRGSLHSTALVFPSHILLRCEACAALEEQLRPSDSVVTDLHRIPGSFEIKAERQGCYL